MNSLIVIVTAIVIAALFLVAGVIVLDEMEEEFTTQQTATANQNFTLAQADYALAQDQLTSYTLYNETRAHTLHANNYTVDTDAGTIRFVSNEFNNTPVSLDYTYYYESWSSNATISALSATVEIGDWLDLVVIVAIAVLIISIVVLIAGKRSSTR